MDALDNNSMPLSEHSSSSAYHLHLEGGSEMVAASGDLVSLGDGGDGDLNEDSKELPLLMIQERLEENASVPEPHSVHESMQDEMRQIGEDVSDCVEEDNGLGLSEDDGFTGCQRLVIVNGCEEGQTQQVGDEQHTSYLVYSPTDNTLRVASSKLTPLLMLANNAEKGMYEANVVFGQNTGAGQTVRCHDSQVLVQPETSAAAEQTTITMTVDGNTQLLLGEQQDSGQLLYICGVDECGVALRSYEEFQQHQVSHTAGDTVTYADHQANNNRILVCSHEGCNRTFSWPTHLKYHELTHTGKRMFKCEVEGCGVSFYTVQRLTVHQRTHTGERPFICTEPNCGKGFTTQGNLKNHARIHSGERPYACDAPGCSRRFAEHSSLRKHMLVHTGSKPYMCELCGKRFSQSGSRNVHMKRHQAVSELTEQQLEKEAAEASSAGVMVKLPSDKVIILQQAHNQLLQGYGEMTAAESVIYSTSVTDHVVTVTTMPAEDSAETLRLKHELAQQQDQLQCQLPASTGANVVVLSQPEEMVAMAPGYHHEGEEAPKDMVYACHQLLNADVS